MGQAMLFKQITLCQVVKALQELHKCTMQKEHRKYGCKGDEHWASSKGLKIRGSCSYVLAVNDDDCARSFCDSVSSVACSNFTVGNDDEKMERKFTLSSRVGNFNAIVAWLQCLSSPIT